MTEHLIHIFTIVSALGCGVIAGVFFAFSTFVMTALGRLPAPQGIAAMQAINVAAINAPFMAVLFGAAGTCLSLLVLAGAGFADARAGSLAIGSLAYLLVCFAVTILFNVPLNNRLAQIDATGIGAASEWCSYLHRWTIWNHVRTAGAFVASLAFTLALTEAI